MTKQEFETLTGQRISDEDFKSYNEMYMNAREICEQTFCEAIKQSSKSEAVRKTIAALSRTATVREQHIASLEQENDAMAKESFRLGELLVKKSYDELDLDGQLYAEAIKILGHRNCVKFKLANEIELIAADIEYINQNLM